MSVADRIVRERKRLGLSQAEFARQAGVSISSQKRYEKGEREPDASYLEAIEAFGADGYYLAYGFSSDDYGSNHFVAVKWLLTEIADALALDRGAFNSALEQLGYAVDGMLESDDSSRMNALSKSLVSGILKKSPFLDPDVDQALLDVDVDHLAELVECFEDAQQRLSLQIAPGKKARSIAMLWRVVKSGGRADRPMIEEAVKLAAG